MGEECTQKTPKTSVHPCCNPDNRSLSSVRSPTYTCRIVIERLTPETSRVYMALIAIDVLFHDHLCWITSNYGSEIPGPHCS